jgi:hypothetical protein
VCVLFVNFVEPRFTQIIAVSIDCSFLATDEATFHAGIRRAIAIALLRAHQPSKIIGIERRAIAQRTGLQYASVAPEPLSDAEALRRQRL